MLAGSLRYNNASLKTADAIHIATAISTGAKEFITNDDYLLKRKLDIEIINLKKFM
jgi:predicted nucleic acid-binding protein